MAGALKLSAKDLAKITAGLPTPTSGGSSWSMKSPRTQGPSPDTARELRNAPASADPTKSATYAIDYGGPKLWFEDIERAWKNGEISESEYIDATIQRGLKEGALSGNKDAREVRRWLEERLASARESETGRRSNEYTSNLDPFAERSPEEQARLDEASGIIDPNSLKQYGDKEGRRVATDDEIVKGVDLGDSNWVGKKSAYGSLQFDPFALKHMGQAADYYGDVMNGGQDAEAEAMWRGRMADSEQLARAQREADLQSLETRGFGGGGGAELLSNLDASQGIATTGAQASLDASGMQQARRDDAAGKYADVYSQIGKNKFVADESRANGMDAFATNKNTAIDQRTNDQGAMDFNTQSTNADLYRGINADKWTRYWGNNDANTDNYNNVIAANAQTRGTQLDRFGNAIGQEGNFAMGLGDLNLGRKQLSQASKTDPFQMTMQTLGTAGNVAGNLGRIKW